MTALPPVVQNLGVAVFADGDALDTSALLGFQTNGSYDQGVGSATIDFAERPSVLPAYGAIVEVQAGDQANYGTRFTGRFLHQQESLWAPHGYSMVLRGMLSLAERYQNTTDSSGSGDPDVGVGGLLMQDIATPDPDWFGVYDAELVGAVLGFAGVGGTINGTGRKFGGMSYPELTWKFYQSSLDYVLAIDQVALGYRTFELRDGSINRQPVYGDPGIWSVGSGFSEGVDLLPGSRGERGVEGRYFGASVHGYNYGTPLANRYITGGSPFRVINSPLILQSNISDGPYLSCEDVAFWQMAEFNIEAIDGTYTTYRTDLLNPGDVIGVYSPNTGVMNNCFVRGVSVQVRSNPVSFVQQLTIRGAAA